VVWFVGGVVGWLILGSINSSGGILILLLVRVRGMGGLWYIDVWVRKLLAI